MRPAVLLAVAATFAVWLPLLMAAAGVPASRAVLRGPAYVVLGTIATACASFLGVLLGILAAAAVLALPAWLASPMIAKRLRGRRAEPHRTRRIRETR